MSIHRWKELFLGLVLLALIPGTAAVAAPLDPAIEAAARANDVDGVAAALTSLITAGGSDADVAATMREVAQLNPDIAGAVVNATVRSLAASGTSGTTLAPTVRTLVNGAMSGVAGTITPDDVPTYAENIATNVRQAIGAVSGGDRNTENALLASARSGVAQSAAHNRDTGASGQVLRSDVNVRLQGTIATNEAEEAVDASPIVVSQSGEAQQQTGQEDQGSQQGDQANQQGDDEQDQGDQNGTAGNQGQQDTDQQGRDTNQQGQDTNQQGRDTNQQGRDTNQQGQDTNQQGRDTNQQGNQQGQGRNSPQGPIVPQDDPEVQEQPQIDNPDPQAASSS
ncbi:hypothetical protein [Endothiovibrio diazotrophicus]